MAKRVINRRITALVLVLVMCFSMARVTVQAAPGGNNWTYAYYLGQEYLGNAGGAAVKPDPVGYGFQGVITQLTFTDDAGKSWTFVWSSEANGEWRITGSGVSEATAKAWPQVTSGKTYVGYCNGTAYSFTLSLDGSAADWTYARNGHANWFYYIRFIRAYTVNVFYQNETGSVIYNGEKFAAEAPLTNYFHFLYPDGGIIDDSEFEDGEYTDPTTLLPADYLPQAMKDLGYEIKYATDANGNDVLSSGVTISLLGENVLNVYCTLIPPATEYYTVIHSYYTEGVHDGSHNGGSVEVEESADFAQVVNGITKETSYNGNTYGYIRYDVDAANKVITLTYTRQLPTYNYALTYNANFGANETKSDSDNVSGTKATSHNIGVDSNSFVRENYTFTGWNTAADGSGTSYNPGDSITLTAEHNTATLYAQWAENPKYSYSVIYHKNFGSSAMQADDQNVSGTYATAYSIGVDGNSFERSNYTFIGWATTPLGDVTYLPGDVISFTEGGHQDLYAKWIENNKYSYSVIYNGNGGTLTGGSLSYGDSENLANTYEEFHTIMVDANTFLRDDYTFTGWNTAADGSGTAYAPNAPIVLTPYSNSITLYAQWTEKPKYDYSVIYNANFGETPATRTDSESVEQTYAAAYTITVDGNGFVRENYTFLGWATAPEGEVVYQAEDVLSFTEGGSEILYAKWQENPKYDYSVIYNANFGENATRPDGENVTQVYATAYTIGVDANGFVRENYIFLGWNTAADGSGTAYAPGDGISLTAEDNTRTLYAQWSEHPKYDYKVRYNANFGVPAEVKADAQSISGIYATTHTVDVDANTFIRENYTFIGWNTAADGSGTAYVPGDQIHLTSQDNERTLYAQWAENPKYDYAVTYHANFASNETRPDSENVSQVYTLQHSVSVDANPFVRENYTFTGWNTAADGSGTAYTTGQVLKLTATNSTADLYAQWAENPKYDYSVIYNANFGANETKADSENASQIYAAEYAIEVDANSFERPNYSFIGWSYTPDGQVDIHSGDTVTFAGSGSITLFALWAEDDKYSYSLTYNGNGGALTNGNLSYGDSENIAETYATKASMKVDANPFVRENYTFTGWNTAADGSGTAYTAQEILSLTVRNNSATLYAQWEENEKYDYTVTYDPNYEGGGDPITNTENEEQIYDDEYAIEVDENPFDREGYTFEGWSTEPNGDVVYQEGDIIEMTEGGDVTLYAQWTINTYEYTVIYMVRIDGGAYSRFEGQLPAGATTGGTAAYGTYIDAEYLQDLPTALYDGPYAYEYNAIDAITMPYGTNTVLVYYTHYSPNPPAEEQQTNDAPQPQNDDGLVDIPDEDVPLADVPKTGDPMMFYLGISALSGLGLLKLRKKEEEEEE